MYPDFSDVAAKEGFAEIAAVFKAIAVAEKRHEQRYLALAENIKQDRVFKRQNSVRWVCRNCGYVHEAAQAPDTCPACATREVSMNWRPLITEIKLFAR